MGGLASAPPPPQQPQFIQAAAPEPIPEERDASEIDRIRRRQTRPSLLSLLSSDAQSPTIL